MTDTAKKFSIKRYFRETKAEMKKVSWPEERSITAYSGSYNLYSCYWLGIMACRFSVCKGIDLFWEDKDTSYAKSV